MPTPPTLMRVSVSRVVRYKLASTASRQQKNILHQYEQQIYCLLQSLRNNAAPVTKWRLNSAIGTNRSTVKRIISTLVNCNLISEQSSNYDDGRAKTPLVYSITERGIMYLRKMEFQNDKIIEYSSLYFSLK